AAAEDGEVLGVDAHLAPVDRPVPDDDAVARQLLLVQPEVGRAAGGEGVQLDEAALGEQGVDALAGALLAAGVLLLLRRRLGPLEGVVPGGEVRELRRGAGEISGV